MSLEEKLFGHYVREFIRVEFSPSGVLMARYHLSKGGMPVAIEYQCMSIEEAKQRKFIFG